MKKILILLLISGLFGCKFQSKDENAVESCINSTFTKNLIFVNDEKIDLLKNIEGKKILNNREVGGKNTTEMIDIVKYSSINNKNCKKVVVSFGPKINPFIHFTASYFYLNSTFVFLQKFDGSDLSNQDVFNDLHKITGASVNSFILENEVFEYWVERENIIKYRRYKLPKNKLNLKKELNEISKEAVENILINAKILNGL